MAVRVAIVEVGKRTRNSLSTLLPCVDTLEIVARFTAGKRAVKSIQDVRPDVILMDVGVPEISGIEMIRNIKIALPSLKVLVFAAREDKFHFFQSLKAGASGYLLKDTERGRIVEAIEEMHHGDSPISSRVARYVVEYFHEREGESATRISILTKRQQEILKGIADGLTYKQLAQKFFISTHTARTHIKKIYEKLQVHSKAEALIKGREEGMI